MSARVWGASLLAACVAAWSGGSLAGAAPTRMPRLWRSCENVNRVYPHGVGRVGAHDLTKGTTDPVTTFRRSNLLYRRAIGYNKGLDRDHDGIACEKL
jgi:Excalibur calcium-binding domain